MTIAAKLSYSANPDQVAISSANVASTVSITFKIVNATSASLSVDQITLTLPQGNAATDLLAPNSSFNAGSVSSSNGTPWSVSANGNQVSLVPVSSIGYATLAPNDSLVFTLSGLQINQSGAGSTAQIAVSEIDENSGVGTTTIAIAKIQSGFGIVAFYASQYNVDPDAPVTITWKVIGALSCEVTADILDVTGQRKRNAAACGLGTGNPTCDGTITSGTNFDDSNTCNVQGATLFTLSALGAGNSGDITLTSQLLVTVNEPAINFTGYPPTAMLGQSIVLQWVAADAAKLQLYIAPTQGGPTIEDKTSTPVGSETEVPLVNTTYYLYAFSDAGGTQPNKQAAIPITVYQPAWVQTPAVSNQTNPTYPGDQFTLNWNVQNVQSCQLSCSVASFQTLVNLPLTGPQQVTVPDPGVAQVAATFTLTPVMYGTQGNYSPQTFPITITNTPNISTGLVASPNSGAPGAAINFTWAADHADVGTLTDNLPGSTWSQAVTPNSGAQQVNLPQLVIPTPITYTLTFTREQGKYSSTTATTVQCTGQVTTASSLGGANLNYLDSLYLQHPNQPINKIGIAGSSEQGINAIFIWYSNNATADYVVRCTYGWAQAPTTSMNIAPGDYLYSITTIFGMISGGWAPEGLAYLSLTTKNGQTISSGYDPGGNDNREGPYTLTAGDGNQIIAFAWQLGAVLDDDGKGETLGDLGIISCSTGYGS